MTNRKHAFSTVVESDWKSLPKLLGKLNSELTEHLYIGVQLKKSSRRKTKLLVFFLLDWRVCLI